MVVINRQEYINKLNNLLAQPAYRPIPKDSTNKIKVKLISILRKVKKEIGLDNNTYKYNVSYGMQCTQILWAPQDPQTGHSFRHIVSSRGSVTYGVAKVLKKIPEPLVGKSPHHIHSTQDFIE